MPGGITNAYERLEKGVTYNSEFAKSFQIYADSGIRSDLYQRRQQQGILLGCSNSGSVMPDRPN